MALPEEAVQDILGALTEVASGVRLNFSRDATAALMSYVGQGSGFGPVAQAQTLAVIGCASIGFAAGRLAGRAILDERDDERYLMIHPVDVHDAIWRAHAEFWEPCPANFREIPRAFAKIARGLPELVVRSVSRVDELVQSVDA
jgi:hypothetical protein